jgi:hypothetical protein
VDSYDRIPARRDPPPPHREVTRSEPTVRAPARPIPIDGVAVTSAPTAGDGGLAPQTVQPRNQPLVEVERIARPGDLRGWSDLLTRYATRIGGYRDIVFDGPILTIGASHTGDMFDVAQARRILRPAAVLIWGVDDRSVSKASEIARFINDPTSVFATGGLPPPDNHFIHGHALEDLVAGRGDRRVFIREGGATTVVVADADRHRGRIDTTNVVPEVRLRGEDASLDDVMYQELVKRGFEAGVRYGIVNFRQSGHSGVGNAPALDTGETGFTQLLRAVEDRRLTPVPMGEFTPQGWELTNANLIKYWTWPSVSDLGRQAEARLLRVMRKKFDIRLAVGMRSGVTDLLNYVGIPTLIIDIHPGRGDVAKGWERTMKRQDRGGHGLVGYELVSLLHERADERTTRNAWLGALHADDLRAIGESMTLIIEGRRAGVQTPREGFGAVAVRAGKILARVQGLALSIRGERDRPQGRGAEDQDEQPVGRSGGKSKRSVLEELREENEARKPLQRLQAQLREDRDLIGNLIAWIEAPSTPRSRDLDDARDDLIEAIAVIRRHS